ncbi:nucleotide-binding universal stress UspA family protein [Microbacterium halimionae]|uniref:Nucleotide-binding universal stress UspA family protein n=1 Tax=Microbacterium halimionae TaxID=1526413 RepID=A0A7W3PKK9_9MICO|nr:universal stress protein [Microbacterium halimionae]MBA8814977.1 nucleotide-binding universal stress UspA family protein [Microbacterium halimionae]NII94232.1 nucleotide-binding universal stress UspA family protein [Microbacterium halimionae]
MSKETSKIPGSTEKNAFNGAVLVGVIPEQPARVVHEAARYAKVFGVPLVVVHVDVTRFVTSEDPDGYVHSAPIDLNIATSEGELDQVRTEVEAALADTGVAWTLDQLVGDPALAIKHHADKIDARLLVIGTRKRGFGESVREFFTGSVAARLAHRQHRPILVVPLGDPLSDEDDPWASTEA